jgi:hypothetical protein
MTDLSRMQMSLVIPAQAGFQGRISCAVLAPRFRGGGEIRLVQEYYAEYQTPRRLHDIKMDPFRRTGLREAAAGGKCGPEELGDREIGHHFLAERLWPQ